MLSRCHRRPRTFPVLEEFPVSVILLSVVNLPRTLTLLTKSDYLILCF